MTNLVPTKKVGNQPAKYEIILLMIAVLVAILLRFYQLPTIPPGFHYDESTEAIEALKVLANPKYRPIFFMGDFGISPLFIYLTAIAFKLFGAGPIVMRAVAALLGSITVPALYWLGKEIESILSRPMRYLGVASASALAVLYWHISFSRVGIEPILVPLVSVVSVAFLLRGLRTRRWFNMALSGLFVGLAPYTYRAGFVLPFLFVAFLLYCLVSTPSLVKGQEKSLILLSVTAAFVLLPLVVTFVDQPELLILRNSQVSVLGEGLGHESPFMSIWNNAIATAKSISFVGDADPRNNLPGRPILDPILSIIFYVGLATVIWRWRDPIGILVLLWLGSMLLPTMLTEYAPQFRRAIGAVPGVALLIGYGVSMFWELAQRWQDTPQGDHRSHLWSTVVGTALCIGYCGSMVLTTNDYFTKWASSPDLFYAFDVGLADIAQQIATESSDHTVYLSPRSAEHPTIAFFLWNDPRPRTFDGRHCIVLPPTNTPATYWIIDYEDWRGESLIKRYLPDAQITKRMLDSQGIEYAIAYRQPADGRMEFEPANPTAIRLGEWVSLNGSTTINPNLKPGEVLYLDLYWESLTPMTTSYTIFVHLLGGYNPKTEGPVWAGTDTLPGAGSYPTTRWVAGERIVDEIQVQIPADMPAGQYQIELGWYELDTMQRVPVLNDAGQTTGDHVLLGMVTVQ